MLDAYLVKGDINSPEAKAFAEKLVTAIQMDLATEQAALRRVKSIDLSDKEMTAKLKKLNRLANFPFSGGLPHNSNKAAIMLRIGASLEALMADRSRFWPGGTNNQVNGVTEELLTKLYDKLFLSKLHIGDNGQSYEIHQNWFASNNRANRKAAMKIKDQLVKDFATQQVAPLKLKETLKSQQLMSDSKLFREAVVGETAEILSLDVDHSGDPGNGRRTPAGYDDPSTRMSQPYELEK
jgi:hypothetical protein